jgi:hypothetical protein
MRLVLSTLCSLILSSVAVSFMVLASLNQGVWRDFHDTFLFVATVLPFVVGFSAVGLFVLMPLAMLLIRRGLSFSQALPIFTIVGAGLGYLMLLWLPLSSWLGAVAGGVTGAIWAVANRRIFPSAIRT